MANPYYPDDDEDTPFDGAGVPKAASASNGLPEWANIHADVSDDEDEAPVAPVRPAVVVPQQVVPTPVAVPAPVRPGGPVRRPVNPGVPVPLQQVPVNVPVPAVVPASIPPVVPKPVRNTEIVEEQAPIDDVPFYEVEPELVVVKKVVAPAPIPELAPKSVKPPRRKPLQFISSNSSSESRSDRTPEVWEPAETKILTNKANKKASAAAGGRWKLILVRVAVWGTLGLVLLLGVMRLINPNPVSIDAITQQVEATLGQNGFPITAGTEIGTRFTSAYLNYSSADATNRQNTLAGMLSSSTDAQFTFSAASNDSYTQKVVQGPYLVSSPELIDSQHATYTFAAAVSTPQTGTNDSSGNVIQPKWVYLQIAVVADQNGHVAIDNAPAFVTAPPGAGNVPSISATSDKAASTDATPTIQGYLAEWASASRSNPVSSVYLRSSSTAAAKDGLGGSVKLVGSPTVSVDALPTTSTGTTVDNSNRTAEVTVQWQNSGGVTYTQTYRLSLVYAQQHWYVNDIKGATFN